MPKGADRLDFGLDPLSFAAKPGLKPIEFFPRVPEGWTDVKGAYTIDMPGFILEEGEFVMQGSVVDPVYDPVRLSRDFPNIDLTARHGPFRGLADEVFVSVLLTGTDSSGLPAFVAQLITLVGEDIYDLN